MHSTANLKCSLRGKQHSLESQTAFSVRLSSNSDGPRTHAPPPKKKKNQEIWLISCPVAQTASTSGLINWVPSGNWVDYLSKDGSEFFFFFFWVRAHHDNTVCVSPSCSHVNPVWNQHLTLSLHLCLYVKSGQRSVQMIRIMKCCLHEWD